MPERKAAGKRSAQLAKLTAPILPLVHNRKQLFRLLHRSRACPLTWISAPPGSGKTTLAASYLKAYRLPVLWYRLDESDADPSTFFHYLSVATKFLAPRYRKPLPVLTAEYALGLPTFTRRYFQELCARLPRRCVLVLDNYQEVPASAALHHLLACGLEELPKHVSMIVMSRQAPPVVLAKLEASRRLAVIGPEQIELSKSEVRALVSLHKRQNLATITAVVNQLYGRMGGWAAGIVLTLAHAQSSGASLTLQAGEAPEIIFQYLAAEVLERLEPDVQSLLLKTSILSDISVPIAEQLTNVSNAGAMLASLHARRYFTERREGSEEWYRYHPLFREFLLERARLSIGLAELRVLQSTAARLLVNAGQIEEGVTLLQAAGDWNGLIHVILAAAGSLVAQGRIRTLEEWIGIVPEAIRKETPWVTFWHATSRVAFSPDEAYPLFEQAFDQFRLQGDAAGLLLAWCGAIRAVLMRWESMNRLDRWLSMFPMIHPQGAPYPSREVEANVADCMAGAIMQRQPYRQDAKKWLDRAVLLGEHLPPAVQTGSRYMTDIYYLWTGDLSSAKLGLAHFGRLSQSQPGNPVTTIFFHATSASVAWFESEYDRCRTHIMKAQDAIRQSGLHMWDGLILSQGVAGELLAGNLFAAKELLLQVDAGTAPLGGIHRAHFLHLSSWHDLLQGDAQEAWNQIQQSLSLVAMEGGHMFGEASNAIVAVHALCVLGRQEEAACWLEQVLQIGDRMKSELLRFAGWVLTAQLMMDRKDEAGGLEAFQKALLIGERVGLMQYPGMQRNVMSQLCAKALEANIKVPFVQRMIQKHRFPAPPEARTLQAWPWRVKIQTLGGFKVEIDGQPLEKCRKAPHRLLDLLKVIITRGGEAVPAGRLADVLWSEADGDAAQENLKKSIARLRGLIGVEEAIQWQQGAVSLNRDVCWVDAWAFEYCIKCIELAAVNYSCQDRRRSEMQALGLYIGPFLTLDNVPTWAVSYRERLRNQWVRLITIRGDRPEEDSPSGGVVRELEQAIDVDPVAEPLYQRLIPLLLANGRKRDAAAQYHRCQSALARWADRLPSVETQQLLQGLSPREH